MFFLYLLTFLFFIFVVIYPLGRYFLSHLRIGTPSYNVILSIVLGLLVFTLEGFIFGLLKIWNIFFVLVIVQSLVLLIRHKKEIKKEIFTIKFDSVAIFCVFLSVFVNSLITFPFGQVSEMGVRFAGAHTIDNNWHLALINSIQRGIPPEIPIYSGEFLKSYHYLVDLQIALLQIFTKIPTGTLFYQIMGPFYIFLYSALAYMLGKRLTGKTFGAVLSLALTALSSNWYHIANYIYPSSRSWPSVAWVDYFSSKSVNYPLLFSMIIMFSITYLLLVIKRYDGKKILILSVIVGSLISFKSHTAIVLIISLGILASFELLQRKFNFLKIFLVSGLIGFIFLLNTFSLKSQGLIFHPFWFIETMYKAPDRLNFDVWELKRQYLISLGTLKSNLAVIKLYLEGVGIFLLVNLGILLVGFLAVFMSKDKVKKTIMLFLSIISIVSFLLTMLFIYSGKAIETIQFFYPAVVSLSLLTSFFLSRLYRQDKFWGVVFSLIICVSLLPGVFSTLRDYSQDSYIYISKSVTEAASFLSRQEDGIVMLAPAFSGNSFISAYSKKRVFLADEIITTGISLDYAKRAKEVQQFFDCGLDVDGMKNILTDNKINYIVAGPEKTCFEKQVSLEKIFSNSETSVYLVSENK